MKERTRLRSVVFDVDYTLADPSAGAMECVTHAFRRMNLAPPDDEAIRRTIGFSLGETFRALHGTGEESAITDFTRLFLERAEEVMLDRMVLFETVRPTVHELMTNGLTLGIVSTKFRYRIEAFLRREGLIQAFSVIVGGEDVSAHKPDPPGLCAAVRALKRSAEEVVYVGDTTTDAEAAANAGMPFAAVLTGMTPAESFAGNSMLAIINDLGELPRALGSPPLHKRGS